MSRLNIFRIVAAALLLLTVEVLGCELFSPNGCESDRFTTSQGTSGDDCCVCCCAHVIVVQPVQLIQTEAVFAMWTALDVGIEVSQAPSIDHPPRV